MAAVSISEAKLRELCGHLFALFGVTIFLNAKTAMYLAKPPNFPLNQSRIESFQMNSPEINEKAPPKDEKSEEIRLMARAVSRGVAIGKIVCLYGTNRQFYRIDLKESAVKSEIKRLRAAINLAKRQLAKIASRKTGRISDSGPGIFESHRMLIEDPALQSKYAGAYDQWKKYI